MIIRQNKIAPEWQKEATALEKKFGTIYVLGCTKDRLDFTVRSGQGGEELVSKPDTSNAPEGVTLTAFEGIVSAKKAAPKPEKKEAKPTKIESNSASILEKKKRKPLKNSGLRPD